MINKRWQQAKNFYHYIQAQFWRMVYGWPDRGLQIYGVTGTNGKTTTSVVLATILREEHGAAQVGLLSTEFFWFGGDEQPNTTKMTTTDSKVVFRLLRRMRQQGVRYVVLELTSHALDQYRLAGLRLAGGLITNITHEHLDYHGTMHEYAMAKAKLTGYLAASAPLVVNASDEWIGKILDFLKERANVIEFTRAGAQSVATPLAGDFNKENVLAARLLAQAVGVAPAAIDRGTAAVRQVPGRVEWIEHSSGVRAVVDFALTPDALKRLYQYLRPEVAGRLIAVFGAAGERDRAKRPITTKTVAKYADEIVLTQDEPYHEAEEQIYADLEKGLDQTLRFEVEDLVPLEISPATAGLPSSRQGRQGGSLTGWTRIEDRREALRYALTKAGPKDVVVVTGMGNFPTRAVGDEKVPWNERAVIEELLAEIYATAH